MGPHGKSLCIEERRASRPIALAQAVLRGEPGSNRLFRSAALAEHVGALLALGTVPHIVGFSGQMAQYLPEHFAGPVVMDCVAVDSAQLATYAAQGGHQPPTWVHDRQAVQLGAYEQRQARTVHARLLASEHEAMQVPEGEGWA